MTKRPKPIRVRDKSGKLYVILEVDSTTSASVPPGERRYELPNRAPVTRLSETEFVVVQTGQLLTQA